MIIGQPMPFQEAIDFARAKRRLPTDLSSEQLAALPAEILEAASFSAGVFKAEHLQEFDHLTTRIAGGATPADFARRAAGDGPLLTNFPAARAEIRGYLRAVGYQAKPGERGTIKDLSSDVRINLKLRTDVAMKQGYGQYTAGQTPATLDLIPCQELVRVSRRRVPRNWPSIWRAAGGKFYGGGRMIAAKDDPIWTKISRFGLPYPPFDYNSGMGLRNVRRKEAVALGVIPEDYQVTPQPRPLPQGEAGAAAFDAGLLQAMHEAGYQIKDGVLTTANYRADQKGIPKGFPGGGRFRKENHFGVAASFGGSTKESAFLSTRRAVAVGDHLAKHFAGAPDADAALASWHQSLRVKDPVQARDLVKSIRGFSASEEAAVLGHIQHVLDITPREIAQRVGSIHLQRGNRGFWRNTGNVLQVDAGHLGTAYERGHLMHEMMHALHLNAPDSYKATLARHFRVRTTGERDVPLGGGAFGRQDRWLLHPLTQTPYAGRIYRPDDPGAGLELSPVYGSLMSRGDTAAHAVRHDPTTTAKVLSIFYHGRKLPAEQGGNP